MTLEVDSLPNLAFTTPDDGDMRAQLANRQRAASRLGIPAGWATVDQVHGGDVEVVATAGLAGSADGLVTTVPEVTLAVFTADCLGVMLGGPGTAGLAHAGWRGLAAGVIENTAETMGRVGNPPQVATVSPSIGPCCFEVGEEVARLFPGHLAETTWGSVSVDLRSVALERLDGLEVSVDRRCTACGGGPSHRRTGTTERMASLAWLS